jgi:hypothetical protein
MSKFNKFNTLLETAFGYYNNGGFREGSCIKLKPSFFGSEYCNTHFDKDFSDFLKDLTDKGTFFFIKRVVADGSKQNVKDANSNEGSGPVFLLLKFDPRTVRVPTELSEFTVPGDLKYVEILKFEGNNLPPVQSEPNKYEKPLGTMPQEAPKDFGLGNQPKDTSLPTKNTSLS